MLIEEGAAPKGAAPFFFERKSKVESALVVKRTLLASPPCRRGRVMRDLAVSCQNMDWRPLLADWAWLVPSDHTPLLIGAFGDWIVGAPDGSHWSLDALEGQYRRIADSAAEFNQAKLDEANRNRWFSADWVAIAFEQGLIPQDDECLGWKVHPMIGGPFEFENIQIFSLGVYQALMGQLHRQWRG